MIAKFKFIFSLFVCIPLVAQHFENPVIPGDFADPSVIRINETYYATGTSSEWAPHYPVFKSTDLINWNYIGPAFESKPSWTKGSFWAPELYAMNNKVYLYYTARRASDGISYIGVASTDNIENGFQDHGCLVEFGTEAIDAFIFEDEAKLYISWKAYGLDPRPIELLCSELSPDGLQLVGEPFMLMKDEDNIGLEGQYMFKKGEYYYIIYSIGSCCGPKSDYAVSVARSRSLKGPYETCDDNPILQGDGKTVQSCGHGTVVETPEGKMYYLYHAYMKGARFFNGRQAFLTELSLNDALWPYFKNGNKASVMEQVPFADTVQQPIPNFSDSFDGNTIRHEWTWNFMFSDVKTEIKDRTLFLSGTPKTGNAYGNVLAIRTLGADYEIGTQIIDQQGISSGLTLYGDPENLVFFGKEAGEVKLKQIKKGEETVLFHNPAMGDMHFRINVTDGCYASFYWSSDQKNWHPLPAVHQNLDVSYLPPWDRAFRPGLIHIGDENTPARFSYCNLNYKFD